MGSLKPQQIQDSNCWLLMVNAANDHKWTSCLVLWPVSGPNNNLTTGKLHCFWNGYFNIQTTISSTSSFSPVGAFQVTMLKLQWLHCRITGWTFSYHIRTYLFKERRHELIKPPDQYLRVKEPCRLSYFHFCSVSSVISTNWHTHAEVAQLLHRNLSVDTLGGTWGVLADFGGVAVLTPTLPFLATTSAHHGFRSMCPRDR